MKERKQKILIVDDAPLNIKILGEALREDYNIVVATYGLKALELAQTEEALDLILLDIVMPDMDGYEVCHRLKENARSKNIPLIFITAKNEMEDEIRGLKMGAVDYITKPFFMPIVCARIKTHLMLKKKSDLLEWLTCTDGLTDIANRRRFDDFLKQEWYRSRRHRSCLSLVFLDVDFFKKYNDYYGHQAGDECLIKIAKRLEELLLRSSDLVARYGGEEFIVVLPETDLQAALRMAEQIRSAVEQLHITHARSSISDHVTVSLGVVAMTAVDGTSPDAFLQAADTALYAAKEKGRNQVQSGLVDTTL